MASSAGSVSNKAIVFQSQQLIKDKNVETSFLLEGISHLFIERSFQGQVADCKGLRAVSFRALVMAGAHPTPQEGHGLPDPYHGSCEELLHLVKDPINETMNHLDYNGMMPYLKMASQLKRGVPLQDLLIDSRNEGSGSTCVGMSHSLIKALKAHGVEGMFAAQRIKETNAFIHAVVIVECQDGYVLFDPRDQPENRFFTVPFEETKSYGEVHFTASGRHNQIPISITCNGESFECCTNIANADDLISKHFMMEAPFNPPSQPAFPVSVYYPKGGSSKSIWISFLQSTLTLKDMNVRKNPGRTEILPFQKLQSTVDLGPIQKFYNTMSYANSAPTFHIPLEDLSWQLLQLVKNANLIQLTFNEVHLDRTLI